MNSNGIGGTRDRDERREHPTQCDERDRGQNDEPPAEYYEQKYAAERDESEADE